jgi:transposase
MRFVDLKSETQLDIQTLHRARDRLVGERTALINQLRAILLERGSIVPRGRHKLEQYLAALPDPENDITLSPHAPAGRGYARRMARAGSADRCFR